MTSTTADTFNQPLINAQVLTLKVDKLLLGK